MFSHSELYDVHGESVTAETTLSVSTKFCSAMSTVELPLGYFRI